MFFAINTFRCSFCPFPKIHWTKRPRRPTQCHSTSDTSSEQMCFEDGRNNELPLKQKRRSSFRFSFSFAISSCLYQWVVARNFKSSSGEEGMCRRDIFSDEKTPGMHIPKVRLFTLFLHYINVMARMKMFFNPTHCLISIFKKSVGTMHSDFSDF